MVIDSAAQIRIVRAMFGMTAIEFARKLGVSSASVANWESGRNLPQRAQRERFHALCRESGVAFLASGMPIPAQDMALPLFDQVA